MNLQRLLGIEYPIVQAPMAGSDNPLMVAAACEAGVLGSLGAQYRTAEEIRIAVKEIRKLTKKPFAVNLFALEKIALPSEKEVADATASLKKYYSQFGIEAPSAQKVLEQIDAEEQLKVLLEERVPVFSFTLGIPSSKWLKAFKDAGTKLIGSATNVDEAMALAEADVDAIAAQGTEAGGHRGTFIGPMENSLIGLLALVPQIVDAVEVPVIAAGGIMDGRGIAAAFALGAEAVQMGTAFLTVKECPINQKYKQAIRDHSGNQTVITKVFSGGEARGIMNKYMAENSDAKILPFPLQNSLTRPIRKVANEQGQIEYTNLWCGQAGRLARELSTKELVNELRREIQETLSSLQYSLKSWSG